MTHLHKLSFRLVLVFMLPLVLQIAAFVWLAGLQQKIERIDSGIAGPAAAGVDTAPARFLQVKNLRRQESLIIAVTLIGTGMCCAFALAELHFLLRRLGQIERNALRAAAGEPLEPPLHAHDALAAIGRIFHQTALSLQKARLREHLLVESALDMVCRIDDAGCFSAANPATPALLGVDAEGVIGLPVLDLIDQSDRQAALKFFERVRAQPAKQSLDIKVKHFSEKLIDTRWTACYLAEERQLLCLVHDMSENLKTARLKQELLSLVSHDMHAPVSSLQKTFSLLRSGKHGILNDEGVNLLERSQRDCDRLAQLTADLLDDDRLDGRKIELKIERCAVDKVAAGAVQSVAALAESRTVLVLVDVPVLNVRADAARLEQIISNLLSNAVKYSHEGGRVTLKAAPQGEYALISVSDSGLGISAARLAHVFERHRQVQDPGRQEPGTGLGLAICKALVQLHGGKIWVESSVEQGSQFSFTVPLA